MFAANCGVCLAPGQLQVISEIIVKFASITLSNNSLSSSRTRRQPLWKERRKMLPRCMHFAIGSSQCSTSNSTTKYGHLCEPSSELKSPLNCTKWQLQQKPTARSKASCPTKSSSARSNWVQLWTQSKSKRCQWSAFRTYTSLLHDALFDIVHCCPSASSQEIGQTCCE